MRVQNSLKENNHNVDTHNSSIRTKVVHIQEVRKCEPQPVVNQTTEQKRGIMIVDSKDVIDSYNYV